MIRRSIAFVLLVWMLGFAWFALLLPQPAAITPTDAVVVLTGGPNRIDRGLEILASGQSQKMLISGVDRDVKPRELAAQYPGSSKYFKCCIDLGFQSVDTRSNALETASWAKRNKVTSLRLITHDWHMRRACLPGKSQWAVRRRSSFLPNRAWRAMRTRRRCGQRVSCHKRARRAPKRVCRTVLFW